MKMLKRIIGLAVLVSCLMISCTAAPEGYPSKEYLDSLVIDFNTNTDFALAEVQIPTEEGKIDFVNEAFFVFEYNNEEWSMQPFVQSNEHEINYLFQKQDGFNMNATVTMEKLFFDRNYYKNR